MDTDEAYLNGYTRGDGNLYRKELIYLAKKQDLEILPKIKSFYPFKAALIIIIDALGVAGWRKG